MRVLFFFSLLFISSCATKYLVPGNRFMTPETNGEAFKGQVELQQASATKLTVNTNQNNVEEGVFYETLNRTGFKYSNSFFDSFDLFWVHIASGNSMLGAKLQVLGGSQASKATGHKIALALALGSNEHETDDSTVEFELGGREFYLLYGYRFSDMILGYSSLSQYVYNFNGEIIGGATALRGLEPAFETTAYNLNAGVEFNLGPMIAKLETTYQQLTTTDTKDKSQFLFGWALGYSW